MRALAAALVLLPVVGFVIADGMRHERPAVMSDTMPVCKTGWKLDAALSPRPAYIPKQYEAGVEKGADAEIDVRDQSGALVVSVKPGQSVAFDCFDDDKHHTETHA